MRPRRGGSTASLGLLAFTFQEILHGHQTGVCAASSSSSSSENSDGAVIQVDVFPRRPGGSLLAPERVVVVMVGAEIVVMVEPVGGR